MTQEERLRPRDGADGGEKAISHGRAGRWIAGGLAIAFGLATLVKGGQVLFGDPAIRAASGQIVPFVVWFNFAAGFAYILAGVATLLRSEWAVWVARCVAAATLVVFVALGIRIAGGGSYETRTVFAMLLRSGFWLAQAFFLPGLLRSDDHS